MAKLIDITGKALPGEWGTDDETGDGIPVLRTTNFTNEGVVDFDNVVTRTITKKNIEEKFLRYGDIIIEKSGGSDKQPVGRVIFFDGPENTFLFNNFTGLLRVKDTDVWNPRYVFYALYGNYRQGGTRAFQNKTTGLHNLKTDDYVSRFDIHELPLAQQRAACEVLDIVKSTIRNRQQQLADLDTLIKARFVEMFGDPVIDTKTWGQHPLGESLKSIRYGTSKPPEFSDTGYAFIRATNIKNGRIIDEDMKYISEAEASKIEKCKVHGGELIIVRSGVNSGDTCVITDKYKGQYAGYDMILEFNDNVEPEFVNTLINTSYMEKIVKPLTRRAAQPHLNAEQVQGMPLIDVPIDLQNEFIKFVQQADKSKAVVQAAHVIARNLHSRRQQKCRILNF